MSRSDSTTDAWIDVVVAQFEQQWFDGCAPNVREFVDGTSGAGQLDAADRLTLICELVAIDLEFRWGMAPQGIPDISGDIEGPFRRQVEHYVALIPELQSTPRIPLILIAEEYRMRTQCADRPEHAEYLRRYAVDSRQLTELLKSVDAEIAADQPASPHRKGPLGTGTATADEQAPLQWSDYVVERQVGAGGIGKVYRSVQKSLSRPVALKFLRRSLLDYPEAIERFLTEARTVARFRHPNIVGVHGLGRTPGGGYFIAMDFISGHDLWTTIGRGPISLPDALRWVAEVADGIAHAHARGVVHCDLKPSNVLIDDDGRACITDFGLARGFNERSLPLDLNPIEESFFGIEGTAAFMAPEQIDPSPGPVSERTDVFGLGGLLYSVIAGRPLRTGHRRVADVLADAMARTPIPPITELRRDIPSELVTPLVRLIDECLQWSPRDRNITAADIAERLRHVGD